MSAIEKVTSASWIFRADKMHGLDCWHLLVDQCFCCSLHSLKDTEIQAIVYIRESSDRTILKMSN